MMPLSTEEIKRKTTLRRNWKKFNDDFTSDFESLIDEGVNGTKSKKDGINLVKKYSILVAPLILNSYSNSYDDNRDNMSNKMAIDKVVNKSIDDYQVVMNEYVLNSINKLNELSIDVDSYNKLRNNGASIVESLSISDKFQTGVYAPCSEKVFSNSLKNKEIQLLNKSDFLYNVNLEDGNGNQLYTTKTWIWSGAEKTRHSGMDNTTIPINESFVVINEVTGDVDYLMYPCDENGSPSNTYNCLCEISYGNEYIK